MNLEKLSVHVPRGLTGQLVTEYRDRCRKSVVDLRAALDRADFEYLRVFGHRLKGTGGAYGFSGLMEIGAYIENRAIAGDTTAIAAQAAALEDYLDRVVVLPG